MTNSLYDIGTANSDPSTIATFSLGRGPSTEWNLGVLTIDISFSSHSNISHSQPYYTHLAPRRSSPSSSPPLKVGQTIWARLHMRRAWPPVSRFDSQRISPVPDGSWVLRMG